MIEIAWPWFAAALPLPVLIAIAAPRAPEAGRSAVRVPFFAAVGMWSAAPAGRRKQRRLLVAVAAWLLLVSAACRPQLIGEAIGLPVTGRDLMLAVDISGSMKTKDLVIEGSQRASRLQVVKQVAGEFIARRQGDRIGLILFGTRAYLQTPLTFDRKTVRTLLDEAVIGLAGERTAIGDAVGLAVKRLHARPAQSRVLVLLTDGSNTAGALEPSRAGEMARMDGLRIHAVGVGANAMPVNRRLGSYAVNPSSDLDEKSLAKLAESTGGQYFRARNAAELESIYALIDALEPTSRDDEVLRPVNELYAYPLAVALPFSARNAGPR